MASMHSMMFWLMLATAILVASSAPVDLGDEEVNLEKRAYGSRRIEGTDLEGFTRSDLLVGLYNYLNAVDGLDQAASDFATTLADYNAVGNGESLDAEEEEGGDFMESPRRLFFLFGQEAQCTVKGLCIEEKPSVYHCIQDVDKDLPTGSNLCQRWRRVKGRLVAANLTFAQNETGADNTDSDVEDEITEEIIPVTTHTVSDGGEETDVQVDTTTTVLPTFTSTTEQAEQEFGESEVEIPDENQIPEDRASEIEMAQDHAPIPTEHVEAGVVDNGQENEPEAEQELETEQEPEQEQEHVQEQNLEEKQEHEQGQDQEQGQEQEQEQEQKQDQEHDQEQEQEHELEQEQIHGQEQKHEAP